MQSTQGQRKASIIFGKRKDVGTSSDSRSSNPGPNSHLARSPSSLPQSALVRLDPRWPCFACRASRAKCEGGFPCSRCVHLSFCCLPNNWKREDPVLDMYVLSLNSPKPFAEMYTLAFEKLYVANKILRSTALKVLKMWNVLSCLAGADVTLGLIDHVRERFNISALELEEPARLEQDPPPHVRMQRLRLFQAHEAKQARTQQLKEMEIFKRANEGAEASNAAVLIFVTTEATMWGASNDYFAGQMREATELWDKALQKQMLWAYLLAPIYAYEDRQQLFDLLAEMIFGHSVFRLTTFVRMYENNGTSNLCLNSAMKIRLGPHAHGMVFKCEAAPPSRHLTTPKGLARVTSRVRRSRAKVGRGKEEGSSPGEGQLNRGEGSVVSSDGSVASSSEGSDAGLGQTQDSKVAVLPFTGIAAFPFGGDGTALPPPPPPGARCTSKTGPNPSPDVGSTAVTTAMALGTMTSMPRTGDLVMSPSSLVARAAAMPTEELEALFAKKAGGKRRLAASKARERVKGEESGRGAEEQQEDDQQMGGGSGAMVEPSSTSQQRDEHQHHYQQHPPQHYYEAQQQVYPSQQGIANASHPALYQQCLSSTPVSSLSFPFALPTGEDEQIQLARSHYQFQQQQAMAADTHGQQQSLHQQEEAALKAREAGWREEVFPAHRLPLLPSSPLSPAPLLDEALLQDVFAEEGRAGGDGEDKKEDKEEVFDYRLEEEEGGGEEVKAGVEEDRNSPLPVPRRDSAGYPWTSIEQQRRPDGYLQQEQQYQQDHHYPQQHHLPPPPPQQQQPQQHHHAGGGVFSMALCSGKTEDVEGEGGMPCAPCQPSLTSPFQGPQPFFHEGMLEEVFADKGTEDCVEVEVWRDAEGTVEGEIDPGEGREKKRKEGNQTEKREMLDLFKDGDIETW